MKIPIQMPTPRLSLHGMTKRFGALLANDAIDLTVMPGEIHALLGENGAGKSTLMKMLYGAHAPDEGYICWNGEPVQIQNPRHARALGISMVYQHFSLFESLTVAENVWLGQDAALTLKQVTEKMMVISEHYGLTLDARRRVHSLSVGERQRVEIVRALLTSPLLLILDEPTSVLTPQAIDKLFETLRALAAKGCSIVYISHKLDEILTLCDNCTVLKAGKVVAQVNPKLETAASLSRLMIGDTPPKVSQISAQTGDLRLQINHLNHPKEGAFGVDLHGVNVQLHAGEVLGIAGISGNGQAELMRVLSGEANVLEASSIRICGHHAGHAAPQIRREWGLAFVPEERLGRGAVPELSLADNMLLTHQDAATVKKGMVQFKALQQRAQAIVERFGVKASGLQATAKSLSGGNLQKFIVGRELSRSPKLLCIAQPTWGVDVGAAAVIHEAIVQLKAQGCGVLLVSEDLDELFALSDRVQVIAKGRLSPSLTMAQASREKIGLWMSGLWGSSDELAREVKLPAVKGQEAHDV